jgi:hypothetical protein
LPPQSGLLAAFGAGGSLCRLPANIIGGAERRRTQSRIPLNRIAITIKFLVSIVSFKQS